jgi:hypothetical protein
MPVPGCPQVGPFPATLYLLREGPCSHGASWAVCGYGVPPYDFLNLYGIFNSKFFASVSQERLEPKSLKGQTKAAELGDPVLDLLRLRLSIKALWFESFCRKNSRKTAEPRVHAPRGDGPSLKIYRPICYPEGVHWGDNANSCSCSPSSSRMRSLWTPIASLPHADIVDATVGLPASSIPLPPAH